MSIVFDRAVGFYDQTRGLPPEIADLPVDALIRDIEINEGSRVLEIGIGTGRIAIPLAERLRRLTGIDLSFEMMQVLRSKTVGSGLKIDLARSDAVRLPFPGESFDIVCAVHVLHLVNDWRQAVDEAKRALKSGGYFVVSWHRRQPDSPNVVLRQKLHRIANENGINTKRPGAQSEGEIMEELAGWGGDIRIVNVVDWTEPLTPGEIIDDLDRQIYSETWMIPRPVMDFAIPKLREWAAARFGSLERSIDTPYNFRWLIARKQKARADPEKE